MAFVSVFLSGPRAQISNLVRHVCHMNGFVGTGGVKACGLRRSVLAWTWFWFGRRLQATDANLMVGWYALSICG